MDELTNQLRSLGEATQQAVPPTEAAQIRSRANEIGIEPDHRPARRQSPHRQAPRRRGLALAAAAALIIAALGSAILLRTRQDMPAALETANQVQSASQEFAVPGNDNGWQDLRFCESTDNYAIDSGNTFYGAYQFTWETFRRTAADVELTRYLNTSPADAPPEIQDAMANALYLDRGADPWPICGRFIQGPMITPVVPQWIGQLGRDAWSVIIFIDPAADSPRVDEIRDEIRAIVGPAVAASGEFIDKQEAFVEFQTMFDNDDDVANSVTMQDMPTSFRIRGDLSDREQIKELRALTGVYEVVEADAQVSFGPPPPMAIRIDALDLETPVFGSATIENLARGPVVLGGNALDPVIAGYGSVAGSVFGRLGELVPGDKIQVAMLVTGDMPNPIATETIRTYVVDEVITRDLQTLSGVTDLRLSGVVLVADVADSPTSRTVVYTKPTTPETAAYGLGSDN